MDVLTTGATFADEVETLKANWDRYDFLFIHFKRADAAGEDGDFQAKIAALEEVDTYIETLHALQADVFMEARWTDLAGNYEFVESLERFVLSARQHRETRTIENDSIAANQNGDGQAP